MDGFGTGISVTALLLWSSDVMRPTCCRPPFRRSLIWSPPPARPRGRLRRPRQVVQEAVERQRPDVLDVGAAGGRGPQSADGLVRRGQPVAAQAVGEPASLLVPSQDGGPLREVGE